MANSLLTPTVILKEAGRLFHQKAKFIPRINRNYDGQFKRDGAKVGYSIALRDRNQYTVTTGATLAVQDTAEASQTLTVNTQKHVGLNFTSADLTMVIDEFSDRYIKPAIAALVANVEADALISMRKKVSNFIDDDGAAFSFLTAAKAKQKLDEFLTPDDDRSLLLCPTHATKYLDASKGLFNPAMLGKQYQSGKVVDVLGNDVDVTTHLTAHQTGTAVATTGYTVNGASQTGASITIQTGTTTFLIGDVVTFAGCNAVHPETKADLGYLKQFVVTANSGSSATTLSISPSIVATGAKQNVSASPSNTGAVVKVGVAAVASATTVESLAFHKDAFIFGSVDLEDMSKYGGWGAVEEMDGISMRIWRQGDIVNDAAPCRIDILYGFLARYPQMAARLHADG
jgi:hypothetical protein